jgi:hypothetical protein
LDITLIFAASPNEFIAGISFLQLRSQEFSHVGLVASTSYGFGLALDRVVASAKLA